MISVIVPVYKAEKYLAQCIDSILGQTFSELEIILVDDGSPDSCPSICDNYAEKDKRIKVIHQKNLGVSAARNAGLAVAQGEYVTFVDSDDYIDIIMYESMMRIVDEYNCDLVICDCMKEYSECSEIYSHNIRSGLYSKEQLYNEYYDQLLIMRDIQYPATISNCVCLFRKKYCDALRYESGVRFSEDWLFGAQIALQANVIYYMKGQAFYHYRMNEQSATHTFARDKWDDYVKLHTAIERYFKGLELYDFSKQIDHCLLFLILNAVGDILNTDELNAKGKLVAIDRIIKFKRSREMFSRLDIKALPVSRKQKTVIYCYKTGIAIYPLIKYYEWKGKRI